MNQTHVDVYITHIEVSPYKKGQCEALENQLSINVPLNAERHIYEKKPIAYFIMDDVLYIPRGISLSNLRLWFQADPVIHKDHDKEARLPGGVGLLPPKSLIQADAMDFLSGEGQYAYTMKYPQLGINLKTGEGKTYAAVFSILKLGLRAIVITHRRVIRYNWCKTFIKKTDLGEENLWEISTSEEMDAIINGELDKSIYIINHALIYTYAATNGWLKVREFFKATKAGIKVIDEAHKYFHNILMIDYFSNVGRNWYITATFGRTGDELGVYKRAFASMLRYVQDSNSGTRKHTKVYIIYYRSQSVYGYVPNLTNRGNGWFSVYKFSDYEFNKTHGELIDAIDTLIMNCKHLEGRALITVPKISVTENLAKHVIERFSLDAGAINSHHTADENLDTQSKEAIVTTIKSLGEGANIKHLRYIINTEPIGNTSTAEQLLGRLREYDEIHDTYFFHLVDLSVPTCGTWVQRLMATFNRLGKEVHVMNVADFTSKEVEDE